MIKHHLQQGFSLVETLVAITILLIVIVGPMTLSTSTARSTNFSSEHVQAFFLAQEGVELMQAYRDDFLLTEFPNVNNGWDDFENINYCFNTSGCGLDVDTDTEATIAPPINCASGNNCRVYYDSSDVRARFNQSGTGDETKYTRVITAEVIDPTAPQPHEVRVESTVTWRSGNLEDEQEVSVVTYLFNVYENL